MPNRGVNWPFMPKPMKTRWTDHLAAFGRRFFFGAALGSAFGLGFWILRFARAESNALGLRCIAGGALAGGLLFGLVHGGFRRDLRKNGRSPPPRKTGR